MTKGKILEQYVQGEGSPITKNLRNFCIIEIRGRLFYNRRKAGLQTSAESWGTGHAVPRIPRVAGGGTHRASQAAFGNMCRGGRMFAPTKIWRKWHRKVNVNQKRYAVVSAIVASAVPSLVLARGHRIESVPEFPLVVGDSAEGVEKTKEAIKLLKHIGDFPDAEKAKNRHGIRPGKVMQGCCLLLLKYKDQAFKLLDLLGLCFSLDIASGPKALTSGVGKLLLPVNKKMDKKKTIFSCFSKYRKRSLKPDDVLKFGLIYAGAQKNVGPSGVTVMIAQNELIGHAQSSTPVTNCHKRHPPPRKAGLQTSAESWGTGHAVPRIPRVAGGGTHRASQAAFGNMCRGGRMFAPTKIWRKWHRKVNVNQKRYAVVSAIVASAVPSLVLARGHRIESVPEFPLVVGDSAEGVEKTKEAIKLLKHIGDFPDAEKAKNRHGIRPGKVMQGCCLLLLKYKDQAFKLLDLLGLCFSLDIASGPKALTSGVGKLLLPVNKKMDKKKTIFSCFSKYRKRSLKPDDVLKFGLIYAGAQKNVGPSGVTVMIAQNELIGHAQSSTPVTNCHKRHPPP
ncbi:hypothetical protein KIW84_064926 [Lathyrus oleraceus]|uniref:60S ribosomal protein L4 n=1 Tax=Pisum sativum TaxID=3888 RepID=A0A9D4WDL0_PEA|nr:hypothetical protein KIW84_064926 [Pisum sativum]